MNCAWRRRKTRFCYAATSAAVSISTRRTRTRHCCRVFIRTPHCLNHRASEVPPVSRWSGCMWHFGFSPFKSIMVESADSRRSLLPLYIKTQKMPRSSHRENFLGVFSADLRASALAMLMSKTDLFPDPERVHRKSPERKPWVQVSRLPKALIVVDAFCGKQKQAGSRLRPASVGDRRHRGRRAFGLLRRLVRDETHALA